MNKGMTVATALLALMAGPALAQQTRDDDRTGRNVEGLYIGGGIGDFSSSVDEIDGLVIKRYPVVAGAGLPAFGPEFSPTTFALDAVRAFDGGNLVEWYSRRERTTASTR